MHFSKVGTTDSGYKVKFGDVNLQNFKVYTEPNHLMGRVVDVLRDEDQNYYLAVETGSWLSAKELVVPVTQFNLVPTQFKIHLHNLVLEETGDQRSYRLIDHSANEAGYSNSYYPGEIVAPEVPIEVSAPLEASAPLETSLVAAVHQPLSPSPSAAEPTRIQPLQPSPPVQTTSVGPASNQEARIPLLEERVVVNQHRRKVGEVVVRKEIETQIVEVPIRREKLVVEQLGPERKQIASIDLGQQVGPDQVGISWGSHHQSDRALRESYSGQPGIPLATAQRVIHRLAQLPQFNQSHIHLVFEDQELQDQYHRWLMEQNEMNSVNQ